jgi:hypothetical protein
MGSKDRLLETIQVNGDWMTVDQIQKEASVNKEFIDRCLEDFVGFQVVQEREEDGVKQYKAIMKKDDE